MWRVFWVIAAAMWLATSTASADSIETSMRRLDIDASYKVRLSAALSLSKTRDPRAVISLAGALRDDRDPSIRRVAALALEKMLDARTAEDARELALAALDDARRSDRDPKVRDSAESALKALAGLRKPRRATVAATTANAGGPRPAVFVTIDNTTDMSKQLPTGAGDQLARILKRSVESTGYATTWPGGPPTSAELTSSRSRGFILASTIKKIEITKLGTQTQIACTVAVRVAPWNGRDGGERWEANRAASASGSAKATTGNRERDIQGGLRDCVEAVAEDVASRQVLPFLKSVASARP